MLKQYDLHHSLSYRLTLAARVSERRFEDQIAKLGLTRLSWCILLAIGQENITSPSEIADYVGVDRTAISRGLRKMEESGLIARNGSDGSGDGRKKQVALSEAGKSAFSAALEIARNHAESIEEKLGAVDRLRISQLLDRLVEGEKLNVTGL